VEKSSSLDPESNQMGRQMITYRESGNRIRLIVLLRYQNAELMALFFDLKKTRKKIMMGYMELQPNKGKNLIIEIAGKKFARYPVKTKLITPEDKDISLIAEDYAKKHLESEDIVFISEKAVAVTQGRSYPIKEIKASKLAKFLSRFVIKTPFGIGLGSSETMQLAIEEVGIIRIALAAFIGALGKIFGIKGLFYIIAGNGARAIDGAVPYAIPPYNTYVSKGPVNPNEVAKNVAEKLKVGVAIVDANDFGVNILGATPGVDKKLIAKTLKDNPLGQTDECTPIGILREIK